MMIKSNKGSLLFIWLLIQFLDVWPEGSYSLLKPISGCPPGFQDGELKLWKKLTLGHPISTKPSSVYHPVGRYRLRLESVTFA